MYSNKNTAILIIDNNNTDQLTLKEEIKNTSLSVKNVAVANTLFQAKQLIIDKPFSLIFLDLFLPDSLGLDSFKELQKVNSTIPVIIYSGFADKKIALKAITLGAQDFLIKGEHTVEMLEKTIAYSIERKKNLEIIKSNNERHETLLKVTNDILWDWNMITNVVSWNGNSINRYLPVNLLEKKISASFWVKRLHPEDRRNVMTGIYEVIKNNQNFWESEYRFLKSDGQYDHIYSRGYVIKNKENLPVRIIGSMQDITDKKLADNKLVSSEKRFKSLTQNSTDFIALLDKNGDYLYTSDSIKNLFGYDTGSLLSKSAFSFVHPDDESFVKNSFLQVFTKNFIEIPPFRFINQKNEWRWVQSTLINMLDETAIGGIIVNSRDITTRIEAEHKLEEATFRRQKEITEAMLEGQEKERLEIGRELHDNINQLLVATKLYIEMGMNYEGGSKDLLSNAVVYIKGAIEEIRKLSKILISPHIKDIGFIESVKSLANDIMHVNPIEINLVTDGFKQNMLNEKFKLNIFRIVQEQINNILKHSQATKAEILFKQNFEQIIISITDNGIGFDTSTKKWGVGISNIFSRAELYSGNVTITSSPGKGCSMTIVFTEVNLLTDVS